MYNQDAYATPSIRQSLHQVKLKRTDLQKQYVGERPPLGDIDAELVSILGKLQLSSLQTIADSLTIPASRTYCHSVEKISFSVFLPRWVPNTLFDKLRQRRIKLTG
jgi:hypothetical protein